MKPPLHVEETATWVYLYGSDGLIVRGPAGDELRADFGEIARRVNAFDALVAVCRDAYILAEDRTDTTPDPCDDTEMLSLMVSAQAALALAKEQQ